MKMAEERKPLEILVIDDQEGILDMLKGLLEEAGANPTLMSGGNEAVDDFLRRLNCEKPYDAVLTDMLMPGGSGTYVISQIKRISPKTPVIAVTAFEPYQVDKFLSQQSERPDAILTKPLRRIVITDLISQLKSYQLNHECPFTYTHLQQTQS